MKKILIILTIALIPYSISAQHSVIKEFFDKYSGEEGFTTINITQKMFSLFASLDMDEDIDQFDDIVANLEGISILVYEGDESGKGKTYFNEINSKIPKKYFEEIMNIRENDENIKFLVSEKEKGFIDELLMLVSEEDEFVFLSMTGKIELNKIATLSKAMNIDGLEHLEDIMEEGK